VTGPFAGFAGGAAAAEAGGCGLRFSGMKTGADFRISGGGGESTAGAGVNRSDAVGGRTCAGSLPVARLADDPGTAPVMAGAAEADGWSDPACGTSVCCGARVRGMETGPVLRAGGASGAGVRRSEAVCGRTLRGGGFGAEPGISGVRDVALKAAGSGPVSAWGEGAGGAAGRETVAGGGSCDVAGRGVVANSGPEGCRAPACGARGGAGGRGGSGAIIWREAGIPV
jgi:hypothetical protein